MCFHALPQSANCICEYKGEKLFLANLGLDRGGEEAEKAGLINFSLSAIARLYNRRRTKGEETKRPYKREKEEEAKRLVRCSSTCEL